MPRYQSTPFLRSWAAAPERRRVKDHSVTRNKKSSWFNFKLLLQVIIYF